MEPTFFNGSMVQYDGATHRVIGRSIDGQSVTYDLEGEDAVRTYEIAEADLEPVSDADLSRGQKPGFGAHADTAATSEGTAISRE